MSDESEEIREKAKKGLVYLLMQRHSQPGAKGWELKRILGKNYMKLIPLIESKAEELGMTLKIVTEEEGELEGLGDENLDRARFVLVSKYPLLDREAGGWLRMEEAASLAIVLAAIHAKGNAESKDDALEIIKEKLPAWRAEQIISKLIRLGYLEEDSGYLQTGWRSKIEIDMNQLLTAILTKRTNTG
ncbi:MAG: hypothetical protein QXX17_02920 [Conexivisphaerales archaeon]